MMSVSKLRKRPRHFLRFSGLSLQQFDRLICDIERAYPLFNQKRLSRGCRKRRLGAGARFRLSVPNRTLLTLVWLRLYLTNDLLGYLFGLDPSNISRNTNLMLPLIRQNLPAPFQPRYHLSGRAPKTSPKRRRKIATLEELFEQYPELKGVIVDSTEQAVKRPSNKKVRKNHYSGKKRRHTRKTQLTALSNGLIVHLSKSIGGRTHDLTLFHRSGLDRVLPAEYKSKFDKGYVGVGKHYPHREVEIAKRAPKGGVLSLSDRRRNRKLVRERIIVEQVIGRVKKYQIASQVYRHSRDKYDLVMSSVCGLVNLRTRDRLQAAAA